MPKKTPINDAEIIQFIKHNPMCSSNDILNGLALNISMPTLRRKLIDISARGLVEAIGELKSRKYQVSQAYDIILCLGDLYIYENTTDITTIWQKFS